MTYFATDDDDFLDSGLRELRHPPARDILDERAEINLGREVAIRRGERVELLRARGESRRARNVTVTFGARQVEYPAGTNRELAIVGTVKWGQGGSNYQAEVDVKEGLQLSIGASSVDVSVRMRDDDPLSVTADRAIVACSASYGQRPARCEPTLSYPQEIFSGTAPIRKIPAFARSLYVFSPQRSAPDIYTGNNLSVYFLGGPAYSDRVYYQAFGPELLYALVNEGLRWPDGARYVYVATLSPAPISLVWGLSL